METRNEIVLYQPNEQVRLEVKLQDESVWLTQAQMAILFGTGRQAITKHISNIYKCGELEKSSTSSILEQVQKEGERVVNRWIEFYNLDVIISVGYRVNTKSGIHFRQWANSVLKEHLLKGFSLNTRLNQMEERIDNRLMKHELVLQEHQKQIDFFVKTALPPVEGILFEGQVLDARVFAESLVKLAKHEIILIDNYVDAKTFDILEVRNTNVKATIFVEHISNALSSLQTLSDLQTGRKIEINTSRTKVHDRFLIIDEQVYHLGASMKDLGCKLFAFSKMGIEKKMLLDQIQ